MANILADPAVTEHIGDTMNSALARELLSQELVEHVLRSLPRGNGISAMGRARQRIRYIRAAIFGDKLKLRKKTTVNPALLPLRSYIICQMDVRLSKVSRALQDA